MRIGLLTYHHVINIGSVLQTWCGFQFIQSYFPDATLEVIDYYPEVSREYNRRMVQSKRRYRERLRERLKRKRFSKFLASQCRFSSGSLTSDCIEEGIDAIRQLNYDVVFVGSDTVFQLDGYFGRLIAAPKPPNLYFLPGDVGCAKIGFAVSCDPQTMELSEVDVNKTGLSALRDFQSIGYRDEKTRELLEICELQDTHVDFMPDPTILCASLLSSRFSGKKRKSLQRPIGVYIGHKEAARKVIDALNEAGLQAMDVLRFRHWTLSNDPIQQYLEPFKQIRGLVTDRFHGSILSQVIGGIPLLAIEDVKRYPTGGKVADLLDRLELSNNLLRLDFDNIDSERIVTAWGAVANDNTRVEAALARVWDMEATGKEAFAKLCEGI